MTPATLSYLPWQTLRRKENGCRPSRKRGGGPFRLLGLVLLFLVFFAFLLAFCGCATRKVTVMAPDGTVTTSEERTLQFRPETLRFFDDAARHQLRMPPRVEGSAK